MENHDEYKISNNIAMSNKIELFRKDNSSDVLALERAKAQIQAFRQSKQVYSIFCKKRKMWIQTTSLERYNELKIENEVKA